jgi:hypothetical protein
VQRFHMGCLRSQLGPGVIVRVVLAVEKLLSDLPAVESDEHRVGGEGREVTAPFRGLGGERVRA